MKTFIRSAFHRIAILIASTAAAAAAPVELAISAEGSGTSTVAGVPSPASRANIVLKRDGRFSIGLVGHQDIRMSGDWRASGDNIFLNVDEAAGRKAAGRGNIELHYRRDGLYGLEWLDASAVTEKGVAYRLRFSVARPAAPPPPIVAGRPVLMKSTRGGKGVFRAAGAPGRGITHAHVELLPNGRATVNVYGNITLGYIGSWKSAGPGVKMLTVTGGIAGETVEGAVRLDESRGTFNRLELSGTHRRVYYSIEFDAYRW